jgi:uncharacterized protein YodC (DUF2158 family)
MEKAVSGPASPRFNIGQDVQLKLGGPKMVVNRSTLGLDGEFVVDTIWFDGADKRDEARGTYQEALLEAPNPLKKRASSR